MSSSSKSQFDFDSNLAFPPKVSHFIDRARVGHLATADLKGRPSVVPICFVLANSKIYSLIDSKPKNTGAYELMRIRNIMENPQATVVVDRWDEDWNRICWILLRGEAEVLNSCPEEVLRLFQNKYPQYRDPSIGECPTISLSIASYRAWGNLALPPTG